MEVNKPVFSKWIIVGLDQFVIGSDKEVYRLPFTTYPNNYGLRKLKLQKGDRWKFDGVWYSKRQLKKANRIKINDFPQVLIKQTLNCPF